MKKFLLPTLVAPTLLCALEVKPWFGNVFEFQLDNSYTLSHYSRVQGGIPNKHVSNDQLINIDFSFVPTQWWSFDAEGEFAHTKIQSWGLRSIAAQLRTLWLDDILGDIVSLATGIDFRYVSHHSLKDVSSPYHAKYDLELNLALGKEWDCGIYWRYRPYIYGAVGQGTRGAPWIKGIVAFEGNRLDRHQYGIYVTGYFGFGKRDHVFINHFDGYAHIHHQSVDLTLEYRYLTDCWGHLSAAYTYRPYAHLFPSHLNAITLRYTLPFSLF